MNKHLQHIEEAALFGGIEGAYATANMFYGFLNGETRVSMKIDGSPSFVIGRTPDGKFFVTTKSFFNKTPIIYQSFAEIVRIPDKGLSEKLLMIYTYLQHLEFDGYLQGDFISGPLEMNYEHELGIFRTQPNTLVYGFEREYDLVVAFHTHYNLDMEQSIDYNFSALKHPDPNVLLMDTSVVPYVPDIDWRAIQKVNELDPVFVDTLAAHPSMPKLITQFFNTKVRAGIPLDHPEMLDEMCTWIYTRYQNIIHKRKSEAGRQTQYDECWSCMQFFSRLNRHKFLSLLSFIRDMTVLKHNCINRLDKSSKTKTWVLRDNEYVPTGPEGYVMSRGGEAYKFVDRTKFSYYNFSSDFVKGWDKPTRT